MARILLILLISSFLVINIDATRVLELSDRFLDVKHEGQWLVMFYAPWCAHCKRTEPIWGQLAQSLHVHSNVRVGRVDCTRFQAVAKHFKIHAYPTIMFIKEHTEHIYYGDRTEQELLTYAIRMSGPPVQLIERMDSISTLKETNAIFFLYVGERNGNLWDSFYNVAEQFQDSGHFYATVENVANIHFEIDLLPVIIVYKEKLNFYFPIAGKLLKTVDLNHLNTTLFQWINQERFPLFPKITLGNIKQITSTNKYLVLAVVEENKLNEIVSHELEFRDLIESVIRDNHHKYHKHFQFGWVGSPHITHSIIMDKLPTPHLLVLNTTSEEHHIPDDDPLQLTVDAILIFLDNVHKQKVTSFGGKSYWIQIYRTYFLVTTKLADMWHGNPILTALSFGVPSFFLLLIFYSTCCGDILDAPEEDDDDDESHEKND